MKRFRFRMGPKPTPSPEQTRALLSDRIRHMAMTAVELGIDDRLDGPLAAAREALLLGDSEGTRRHLAIALAAIAEVHEWRIEHEARQH